ncbi:MAG TPA: efflux RND transporter periplasmic adaptor subunit [Vicinamibacterales bacterium]|jgi:HlyD family secretion protein
MKARVGIGVAVAAIAGLSVAVVYARRAGGDAPNIVRDAVSRGSIVSVVSASGTLEAVETVQVGTQVSGSVQALYADFNSIVRKGQVLARLDPSLIQADIARGQANLAGAEADAERLRVALNDAETKLQRARQLADRQLIPTSDLDAAEIARKTADAQVKSAAAQVTQARASLSQSQVNLGKTVIASPIDGIVISRAVDVGQTVAASLQAPTLFSIAADLSQMQLKASIDESDVGNIRDGQAVTFRVDAYPTDTFRGVVKQVRLDPVVEQNVVTYAAIISAPNPDLKLKPGMTATVTVEIARRENALRVPAAALRFRPSAAVLEALGQPRADGGGSKPSRSKPSSAGSGTVWIYDGNHIRAQSVKTGISDGQFTEIVDGDLQEGTTIATQIAVSGSTPARPAAATSNPLMGPTGPRRF